MDDDFIHLSNVKTTTDLTGTKRDLKMPETRDIDAKCSDHVPDLKMHGFRVSLENGSSDFGKNKFVWECILHKGSGKGAKKFKINNSDLNCLLTKIKNFKTFRKDVKQTLPKNKSAKTLQEEYCQNNEDIGPVAYLKGIRQLVDKHFPKEEFETDEIEVHNIDGIRKIPTRIIGALFAGNHLVSKIK
jgi:hypothetical protein